MSALIDKEIYDARSTESPTFGPIATALDQTGAGATRLAFGAVAPVETCNGWWVGCGDKQTITLYMI